MSQEVTTPLLSDSLFEKLCEARRYPGQMITHAWDARLQGWVTQALAQEERIQSLNDRLRAVEEALKDSIAQMDQAMASWGGESPSMRSAIEVARTALTTQPDKTT